MSDRVVTRLCGADPGANVQLGPGVCLARVPVNGRNFEYVIMGWIRDG